ncbi:MAG: pyruvate dehydrogenase complex dihydrolipoamide acetyltransferase [Gemmatimonadota bacterium]
MATKVVMEALSPTMEEGRLVEWKKKEGEKVSTGDVLAEVETDKAVMELVARAEGVLLKQVITEGTTVPVSSLVGVIGNAGEDISALMAGGATPPAAAQPAPAAKPSAAPAAAQAPPARTPAAVPAEAPTEKPSHVQTGAAELSPAPAQPAPASAPPSGDGGRVKASPLARKIAAERGVSLAGVAGSGPEGRIIRRDLDGIEATARASEAPAPTRSTIQFSGEPFRDVPLSQIRKTIAKRLVQSIGPVPTFYLTTEIDMERAWDARVALKALGPEGDVSFNDIVIKATALALKQHPNCNAWWQDDHIRVWNEVHIGMAVAVEDGLITPVIRHADLKSLREISSNAKDFAGRARERRLKPEEYTGSTFSVSNLGMFGIDEFTAIINPPEAGILAVGQIVQKMVVIDNQPVVRRRLRVTMSCDHRVIDGASGAQFLKTLRTLLENPLAMVW